MVDGVSLTLAPGARVAVVGPSGAGKTTLAHALVRFVDAAGGRVTIGGRDVREVAQADLRERVRLAGQEAHLFATSVAGNVRVGDPEAGDGDVLAALERVGLGAWVAALPDGLATAVGERGRASRAASAAVGAGPARSWRRARASWSSTSRSPTSTRPPRGRCSPSWPRRTTRGGLLVITHALTASRPTTRSS